MELHSGACMQDVFLFKGYPLPADVDTGLDTVGCDDGTESSGNLMTGLACESVSSSGKAVIRGPLVAEKRPKIGIGHFFAVLNPPTIALTI